MKKYLSNETFMSLRNTRGNENLFVPVVAAGFSQRPVEAQPKGCGHSTVEGFSDEPSRAFSSQRRMKIIPPIPPLEKGGKGGFERPFSDERGTALVVAMIFLGLLTTIGLYALLNSTTELMSSARYKSDKEAFYAAEGAIEYVKGDGHYFTTQTSMNIPDPAHPDPTARDLSANGTDATGTITFVTTGNPPPGSGFSAKFNQEGTMANYFRIEAIGTSQARVQSVQEEGVAKILPRS